MPFGEKLRILRKRKDLTQADVASSIGTTMRAVRYYESYAKYTPLNDFTLYDMSSKPER